MSVLFSVKWKGESKLVAVNEGFTYANFVADIVGKWVELNEVQFYCLCSVGGISSCCLESEIDLKNLCLLCNHTGSKLVLADVCCKVPVVNNGIDQESVDQIGSLNPGRTHVNKSGNGHSIDDQVGIGLDSDHRFRYKDKNPCDNEVFHGYHEVSGLDAHHMERNSVKQPCASSSKRKAQFQSNDELGIEIFNPSYDVCPPIKKKPLLSDGWANLLDVGVGQEFSGGAIEFRKQLIKYAAYNGFNFKYTRNTKRYIYASCRGVGAVGECSWFVNARLICATNKFQIYKANTKHTCEGNLVGEDGICLGSKIIADLVVQNVKNNVAIGGKEIAETLLSAYGINAPYWKARRSVHVARQIIFGRYEDSYNELRWYKKAIERTNPGSVVALEINQESNRFERMFLAFKASIDGFRCCRQMLFIDGTFMKGQAKGILLSATAKDGDNGLFPVALAIVDAENTENWEWFLKKLRDEIKHERQILYISDRNTELMSAFPLVWDEPVHFFCLFHLLTNLKGKFSRGFSRKQRAKIATLFTNCAYAPNIGIFKENLDLFKKEGGQTAEEWLEQLPYEKWAVSYSQHIPKYGEMTSNAAESFNSWIRKARSLPITNMIDKIRRKLSRWYVKRRKVSSEWTGALCPTKDETWSRYTDYCRSWKVEELSNGQYEVHSELSVTVSLPLRICTCYQWQIRGFPCPHAVAAIRHIRESVYDHVHESFLARKYRESYMFNINAIPETERFECQGMSDEPTILPPEFKKRPGRPKTIRKKSFGEGRKIKKKLCKTCGAFGYHDSVSCLIPHDGESENESSYGTDDDNGTLSPDHKDSSSEDSDASEKEKETSFSS